jgi:Sec-independent protein translocase protein TatA
MLADIFGTDGIIVLIVCAALLCGATAIPKLARSLGSAKNEFRKGSRNSLLAEPERRVVDSHPVRRP